MSFGAKFCSCAQCSIDSEAKTQDCTRLSGYGFSIFTFFAFTAFASKLYNRSSMLEVVSKDGITVRILRPTYDLFRVGCYEFRFISSNRL